MRVQKEPSFVIHTRPYSETSLFVEILSRHYGRLTVIAKGARRQKSGFRGMLMPFRQLLSGWSGKGEIPTLTQAEPAEPWVEMRGHGVLCGFYVNELVIKLLHRYDAHPKLFDFYAETMEGLRRNGSDEGLLRLFEKRLLGELGYAMNLEHEATDRQEIRPEGQYRYIPRLGAVARLDNHKGGIPISGAALRALKEGQFRDERELKECKKLMRTMIAIQLDNRPLHSRKLFR